MKKAIVLFLVAFFCLGALPAPGALHYTAWYNLGDRGELYEAMQCAITRLRAATCLDLDISLNGAHLVRWASDEQMPNDSTGYTSGPWGAQSIRLREGITPAVACTVLVHEIVHGLRQSYGHPLGPGTMSHPTTRSTTEPISRITQGDLDLICAKQACGCEIPETP